LDLEEDTLETHLNRSEKIGLKPRLTSSLLKKLRSSKTGYILVTGGEWNHLTRLRQSWTGLPNEEYQVYPNFVGKVKLSNLGVPKEELSSLVKELS